MKNTSDLGFANAAIKEVARMHELTNEEVLASISEAINAAKINTSNKTNSIWNTVPDGTSAAWLINASANAIMKFMDEHN